MDEHKDDDVALTQRIRYLIEHGGLWEDPLADIRLRVRWAVCLAGASCALTVVDIFIR